MKKVISFLAGDGGNFHFLKPVISHLEENYDVRMYNGASHDTNELQRILNESDIVWYEWGNGPVVQASHLSKKAKTICRIHRYEILGNEIKAVNWKNIDNLIFVNEEFYLLFKELVNKNIEETTKVYVIPNPVDEVHSFIEKEKGYNIAYVSRFNADKNPSLMIQVLKKLTDVNRNYKIHMAGGVQDLQLYLYCKHLIKELNLENNFIYEGTISDIPGWLKDKNYFLSTSIVEAHPVSVTEAMMLGIKPILHNSFGRLGKVFNKKFLYNTPEEAVKLICENQYNSKEYNNFAVSNFSTGVVLPQISKIIEANLQVESGKITSNQNNEFPFISVAIVTYNRAKYLPDAINSVIAQEGNYEIVVVDDGSTDNTKEIVEGYKSDRIRYFRNDKNLGRPGARNRCVAEAKGEYILWLGDDDMLVPGMLREYSGIITNDPSVDIIYGNVQAYDQETGKDLALFSASDYTASSQKLLMNLIMGSGLTDGGSMIRRSLYDRYGGYDSEYLRAQDNELWTRVGPYAKFHKVNRTIYRYRKHSSNVSFGSFVDTSYESKTIRRILNRYPIELIFGNASTEDSLFMAAHGLFNFGDFYNSTLLLKEAGIYASAKHFELYLNSLINMGNLDDAENELGKINSSGYELDKILTNARARISSLRSFRNVIETAHSKNDFGVIKNTIQQYLVNSGNTFDTVFALGKMLAEMNEQKMASDYLKLALKYNPVHNVCYELLMKITSSEKERQNIKQMKDRLLEDIPLYSKLEVNGTIEKEPLVSVIITTYNRKTKLPNAIESVLKQSYKNFEILVVNDAGEDVTDVVNKFKDSRIKLFAHDNNKGIAGARNTGIKAASGKYIALLDDDDIFYPDHIETALSHLNEQQKVIYTDATRLVYEIENGVEREVSKTIPYSIDFNRNKLLIANISPVNCFVFERSLAELAGGFNEEFPVLEDWDFWIRLSAIAEFKHINKATVQVNWCNKGKTLTTTRPKEFETIRNYIYQKHSNEINAIPNKEEIVAEFNAIWRNDFKTEPVVSIIALTYNQVDYTKAFVESVLHNTKVPFELILIDNKSSDDTVNYLSTLSASNNNIKVILNNENLGFPKGINQGIKASSGKYILIANNDILVTENWLNRMVEAAESNPAIGLIGPLSNAVSGVQLDKDAKYTTIEEMFNYANKIRVQNKGKMFVFPRIAFLCTLIKREVIEKIGGLDERFTPGNFEDDDFCLRAQLAGYKTVILQDVFIHHFGSKSFTADGTENYANRLEVNKQKFVNKWGSDPEEIWLKGKSIAKKSLVYPINNNIFVENFDRAVIQIEDKEYSLAESTLNNALKLFDQKGNSPVSVEDINSLLFNLNLLQSKT